MTERGKKIRETFFKKYGVYHPSQLPDVKAKIKQKRESGAYDDMIVKMKKTKLQKYGDENYSNLEKGKKTKLKKYGDENFNNREKMLKTNVEKYGMNVSPNTLEKTKERVNNGEIGFKSEKYKKYLENNNIDNVSQLSSVREKRRLHKIHESLHNIFEGNRLKGIVIPLFKKNEYVGTEYNNLYKFQCCICHNEFNDNLYSGNIPRCLVCNPHNKFKSTIESEILDFLHSHDITTKHNDRNILDGIEIDILVPRLNLGIECDGIYWHSEIAGGKDKHYHLNKTKLSLDKNIQLMHIWDWEWRCKQDIIKSILLSKIGKCKRIFARKCEIKQVINEEKSMFLNDNHIQQNDTSSIRLGLYHNNILVSIMTFVKSRYDKKYQYELSRYCNILNTNVIGGASKLFSYFVKNHDVNSIVTYSDRRLFTGNLYKQIGMSFVDNTPSGYHYFHKNKGVPIERTHFQKHKLKEKIEKFDINLSEWQNMQINGYDRIWDCGHMKFSWNRK
jgi:hypothetical protein